MATATHSDQSQDQQHTDQQAQQNTRAPQQHNQGTEDAVLKHGRSTMVSDIRAAATLKYDKVFLLTAADGDIVPGNNGLGLFFRDTCFLNAWEMRLNGQACTSLLANAANGSDAAFELTNPDIQLEDGRTLPKERLSLRRKYDLREKVQMTLEIHSLGGEDIDCDLTLAAANEFYDMFTIRGTQIKKRGTVHPPQTHGKHKLVLAYDGADGHHRSTTFTFDPAPASIDNGVATFHLALKPRARTKITVTLDLVDAAPNGGKKYTPSTQSGAHKAFHDALNQLPTVSSDNALFNRAIQRSFKDLQMLATELDDQAYIAAGIPWYVALFGRDSCISAFELLPYQAAIAKGTLAVLAKYQGTQHNAFQEEDPGKILHELRVGEQANLHEVPQIPYYGTVDATPWFLILLSEYVRWTGDIATFQQYAKQVEAALGWIDTNMRQSPSGFLDYGGGKNQMLSNQGWKDSGNSIVNSDGSLAVAPIALVEVQGYVYAAKRGAAELYRHTGDTQRADTLDKAADDLRAKFNQAYWDAKAKCYALCIQKDNKQAQAIASNPGQALFSGIADPDKAQAVAQRLVADDMFSGWGIRTLSANAVAYNPLDYQVGSIWPHDNALIALGLRRYGCADEMEKVFTGVFQAATQFTHERLPEVFDGFSRDDYQIPVHYPVACSPQAWAAGSLPLLLRAALGLEPDALAHRLMIHHPHLPPWLNRVTVQGLRVGQTTIDLQFQRSDTTTLVAVQRKDGPCAIDIEY